MSKLADAFGVTSMVVDDNTQVDAAVDFILTRTEIPGILELKVNQEDVPPFNVEASVKF
jgi:thiamine pyrophosphate-dependent acetolactate synthase large subunit-like protein